MRNWNKRSSLAMKGLTGPACAVPRCAGTVTGVVGNKHRSGGEASKFESNNFYGNEVRIATGQQGA